MASDKSIVLYVEDEETDRILMQLAFKKAGLEPALRTVNHGQAAIDYLLGAGAYGEREKYPLPGVVLLDLNLPGVHGFEVLKWIREQSAHSRLPGGCVHVLGAGGGSAPGGVAWGERLCAEAGDAHRFPGGGAEIDGGGRMVRKSRFRA